MTYKDKKPSIETTNLLQDCLKQTPIEQTKSFIWFATPVGIAALCKEKPPTSPPPYEEAITEAEAIALDLSREEVEIHQISQGFVLLFYS